MDHKPIHDSAGKGYTAAADTYASDRPDYPPAIVDWLREMGLDANQTVLDLGAGTGPGPGKNLSTPRHRRQADRRRTDGGHRALLAERYERVEVLDGTAEHIR